MRLSIAVLILTLTALHGCGNEGSDRNSRFKDRASASGEYSVDPKPEVIVPADSGEQSLIGHAVGATRLSDGSILVADAFSHSIHEYDERGRYFGALGRRGAGPGEFESLDWIGQCQEGDIFAWDKSQQRLTHFDRRQSASLNRLPGDPVIVTCSPSGLFATLRQPSAMTHLPSDKDPPMMTTLMVLGRQGESLWTLPNLRLGSRAPLGTITRIALSRERLYVGTGDSAWVDGYDLRGKHVASLQVGGALRPATASHFDRAIDEMLGTMPAGPAEREQMKKMMLARIPMPDHLPPYTAFFSDPGGALWVVTTVPGDDSTELRAFSPAGEALGGIRLPVEMRIFEVGRDYLLGAFADSTGQELVAEYHYSRAP